MDLLKRSQINKIKNEDSMYVDILSTILKQDYFSIVSYSDNSEFTVLCCDSEHILNRKQHLKLIKFLKKEKYYFEKRLSEEVEYGITMFTDIIRFEKNIKLKKLTLESLINYINYKNGF